MSRTAADRSFRTLAGIALVPYALVGLFGCGFLSLVAVDLVTGGWSGLSDGGRDLRPTVLLLGAIAACTVVAAISVHRQVLATRRLATQIADRRVPPPVVLAEVARTVRLAGRIDVLDDQAPYSFTYGLTRARVAISTGMIGQVDRAELEAVLRHERYHVRRSDTVKLVVARAATTAFFFLPAIKHLTDRYVTGRELAADRAAIRALGQRPLAGALAATMTGPPWANLDATAALAGGTMECRLVQLETGREPGLPPTPRRAVHLTAVGLGLLGAAFAISIAAAGTDVLAMDGSMPSGPAAAAAAVVGSAACAATMAVGPAWLLRRRRHR